MNYGAVFPVCAYWLKGLVEIALSLPSKLLQLVRNGDLIKGAYGVPVGGLQEIYELCDRHSIHNVGFADVLTFRGVLHRLHGGNGGCDTAAQWLFASLCTALLIGTVCSMGEGSIVINEVVRTGAQLLHI